MATGAAIVGAVAAGVSATAAVAGGVHTYRTQKEAEEDAKKQAEEDLRNAKEAERAQIEQDKRNALEAEGAKIEYGADSGDVGTYNDFLIEKPKIASTKSSSMGGLTKSGLGFDV